MQNRALLEENARLTDLTRMLLSSPHFSNFLNDLTVNGLPPQLQAPQQPAQPTMPQASLPASTPQDSTSHRSGQDFPTVQPQNFQVGMVMVPDHAMDLTPSGWNTGIDMNFTTTPIFAVLEVPEGPAIDTDLLSGKSSNSVEFLSSESAKEEPLTLDRPPVVDSSVAPSRAGVPDPHVEVDEHDPSLALFLDDVPVTAKPTRDNLWNPLDTIEPRKSNAYYELVVEDDSAQISGTALRSFERLCSSMEAAFQRVSIMTSHLL